MFSGYYTDPLSLNKYTYCHNNPVNYYDPDGHFVLSLLATLGIAALIGAGIGVVGTFVGDIANWAFTGEWAWSSWETYLGNAIGGAVGGSLSLIPVIGPFAGTVIAGTLGTFSGLTIGKATGSNTMSWGEIGMMTVISFGVSLATAGMTRYLKIPDATKGSHSWQQVFKSGLTKTLRYGFRMSGTTLLKGAGYLLISGFSTGFLASNALQGFINAQFYVWNKRKGNYIFGSAYV